jgi:hypothetical protein
MRRIRRRVVGLPDIGRMVGIIGSLEVPSVVVAVGGKAIAPRIGACYAISGIVLSSGVVLSLGVVVSLVSVVLVVLGPSVSLVPSCTMLRGALKWWMRRAVITLWRVGVVSGVGLAAAVVVAVLASFDGGSREVGLGTLWLRGHSGISGTYLAILFTAYIPPPVMIAVLIKPMLDAGSLP